MRFVVVAVGRLKEPEVRRLADEYLRRSRRYARCDELEVAHAGELERAIPPGALRVALEVDGEALSSLELSRRVQRWTSTGKGVVAFLIGGAEGLPAPLSRAAEQRLSLSSLTLPHRLARVLLYEQIYRSLTLLRGEPYAREG